MIEVGGVGDDERESFVRAFATAFSNVVEQPFIADVLTLFDHDVYRPIAARDDGRIVGTALEMPLELTVRPGVTVPCRGITWVGVLPTHRRRGVMRALLGTTWRSASGRAWPPRCCTPRTRGLYPRLRGRDAAGAGDGRRRRTSVPRPGAESSCG